MQTSRARPLFSIPANSIDYFFYVLWHLACLLVLWTGISWRAVILCAVSYLVRMFAMIAGHHRYFSHRSYTLSRPVQFLLALVGTTSGQRGLLWWVASHRYHHLHSDVPDDIHSPVFQGFAYAHSGWFLDLKNRDAKLEYVPDLAKYPELVWLSDWAVVPTLAYGALLWAIFGLEGLAWGFFVSTILVWHGVHALSSFAHTPGGSRRYPTPDYSRNKWYISLFAFGDGWHNNHHYYPAAARHGFRWYELDPAYYLLKVLSWIGIVRDLKIAPEAIVRGEIPGLQRRVQEYAAELAEIRAHIDPRFHARFDAFAAKAEATFIAAPDDRLKMFRALRRDCLHRCGADACKPLDRVLETGPFIEALQATPHSGAPAIEKLTEGAFA